MVKLVKSKAYLKNLRREHHLGEFAKIKDARHLESSGTKKFLKKKGNPCKRPAKFKSAKQRKSWYASRFKKAKDSSFF